MFDTRSVKESEKLTMRNAAVSTPTTTNINIRIDGGLKKEAEILFGKLGLSISGGINIFFRQAIREQAIPFELTIPTAKARGFLVQRP